MKTNMNINLLLELLRRPPVNMNSELVEKIMKANESRRVLSYIEAGCINIHDSAQSMSNCMSTYYSV